MNAIFTAIFIAASAAILIFSPESFLPSALNGAGKAVTVSLTLFGIYAVWMGLSKIAEECGITRRAAKLFKPLAGKCFKTNDEAAAGNVAMNIACNLLGIGGAATPYAVKAIGQFEKEGNKFAQKLLFVVNATSIQILPTTVIALRAGAGSAAASDIFLPSLLCSAACTAVAVALFLLTEKIWPS